MSFVSNLRVAAHSLRRLRSLCQRCEIRAGVWVESLLKDLEFALRHLRRSPGFTFTAVLTLALGIGATTAIFSLVDGILLRPLTFPESKQLVAIDTMQFPPGVSATNSGAARYTGTSYPDYFDWQRQNRTFESLASFDAVSRLFSSVDVLGAPR